MYSDISGMLLENKYMVKEKIGKGAFSCVYRVMDEHIEKEFAMKVIYLETKESECMGGNVMEQQKLTREIQLLRNLNHRGLPQLHDVFLYHTAICIVMELIQGETLDGYVLKRGKCTEREVWEIGKQIAEILKYLHSQSVPVIYTDLKPGNILFDKGVIRMVDLGGAFYQFSKEKYFYATRGYAAPELEQGGGGTESDIYSFGRIMIFLLTARHPFLFDVKSPGRVLKKYGVAKPLRKMIERCVQAEPEKRFRSGCELLDYINRNKSGREKGFRRLLCGNYKDRILECECSLFVSQGL